MAVSIGLTRAQPGHERMGTIPGSKITQGARATEPGMVKATRSCGQSAKAAAKAEVFIDNVGFVEVSINRLEQSGERFAGEICRCRKGAEHEDRLL